MRKQNDRFNGVTEEELYNKTLNDIVDFDLDIVFVNINPGLYSVFKQHHYSGPGNHFWRCLYDSGLTNKVLKSTEDYRLLEFKMGLVNMIEKPNIKSCQELSNDEIREASENLVRKIRYYRPKIVAFNGKTIYEIYTGQSVDKLFDFGKQPIKFDNNRTDTLMFVMPSSSARCAQLPKVIDKVPFYVALKKLRDYLNGLLIELNEADITFPDFKVALEVDNNNSSLQINDSKLHDGSDLDDDDEAGDIDDSVNLNSNSNNHKIKFVRLNNLAYSQIPNEIMANLKVQRNLRKNVTITTTKDYFNIKSSFSKTPNSLLNRIHKTNTAAFSNASCSDVETASTATNDSMDYSLNNNNNDHEITSSSSSKLSSLILNVCSANNNNNNNNTMINYSNNSQNMTIKQALASTSSNSLSSQPIKNILQQNNSTNNSIEKLNDLANQLTSSKQLVSNSKDAKIKNLISKPALDQLKQLNQTNQNTPTQIARPIVNSNQNSNIIIVSSSGSTGQIIQQPLQNNIIIVQSSNNNGSLILNNNLNQQQQQPQKEQILTYNEEELENEEEEENDNYIQFEFMRQEDLNDYYEFDLQPLHSNASIYLNDDYSTALRNDLSKSIKLFYGNDDSSNYIKKYKKRKFSNLNDASNYVANNIINKVFATNINKRQCKVDLKSL